MARRFRGREDRDDQAIAWLVRLRSPKASPRDRAEFALWLAESEHNKIAFDTLMTLWRDLEVVKALPVRTPRHARQARRAMTWQGLAAAASCAVAAIALLFTLATTKPESAHYSTAVGEQAEFRLTDGSDVTLNTDTDISVTFTDDQRRVHLAHGEAFFEVSPDRDKPFIAVCGPASATAVGTAFNVRCEAEQTEVTVTEGIVRVGAERLASGILVKAGEHIVFDHRSNESQLGQGEQDVRLAWLENSLVFNDASLSAVVMELQRYTQSRIRLADPRLGGLRVSGRFNVRDPKVAVQALAETLPVVARYQASGQILILPAQE